MAELRLSALGALSGDVLASLRVPETWSVAQLRRSLAAQLALEGQVKLFHDGQPLAGTTLAEAGLRDGAEIQVVVCRSQQVLAGATDGTTSIWDLEGPTKVQEFHHGAELHAAAVSPDGKFLGTAGCDGQVILWQRGPPVDVEFNLQGHQGQVYSISFCPISASLLSASGDATARLWDMASGQELLCLRGHRRDVNACDISPDSHVLATGSDDYCFAAWDRRSGQQICHWDGRRGDGHSGRVYAVAFGPEGRYLATGAVDKKAKVWDMRKGSTASCLFAFTKHTDLVNSVQFSADGKLVASASDDGFAYVWTPHSEAPDPVAACHPHPMAVLSASFADDGGKLVTGCSDGKLRIFNQEDHLELCRDDTLQKGIKSVCFFPA